MAKLDLAKLLEAKKNKKSATEEDASDFESEESSESESESASDEPAVVKGGKPNPLKNWAKM